VELPIDERVTIGRRSHPSLNNLHISRDQVYFDLKRDNGGKILICMTNVSMMHVPRKKNTFLFYNV